MRSSESGAMGALCGGAPIAGETDTWRSTGLAMVAVVDDTAAPMKSDFVRAAAVPSAGACDSLCIM